MSASTVWALGDYDRVARDVLAPFGPELVAACAIGPGMRVLDVAAGTGNVALAAARAGADVTASDLTPELLETGRRRAEEEGLELTWTAADAQALPFPDAAFDVVTSAVGAMFAPDQEATAAELLRVCRPAGRLGLIAWTPGGWASRFFGAIAAHLPPPPGPDPARWGDPGSVAALLGDGVTGLDAREERLVVDHFAGPAELRDYYAAHFGPVVAARAALGDATALDRDIEAFAAQTAMAPGRWELEYLRVVARRA